jgi:hypothetical protein
MDLSECVFISISNVDTKWIYLKSFFSIFLYSVPYPYSTKNMKYPTFICIHEEWGIETIQKFYFHDQWLIIEFQYY